SGKSSLVFDTLHAEGQRRYVETFSAYTRQFLDLLDKPRVDSVENIRPSIAIEQRNTVKTSRSTVGTMTELTDFAKVWFSQVATCFDPETGEPVEDDTPESIWRKTAAAQPGAAVVVAFRVDRPEKLSWPEILSSLAGQSYVRVLIEETSPEEGAPDLLSAHRVDALRADPSPLKEAGRLFVAQDRLTINTEAERQIEVEALQVVLAHAAEADAFRAGGGFGNGHRATKVRRSGKATRAVHRGKRGAARRSMR
ncbi:MAG: excinuclease ABC subunit A, partial [Opitutaceae bacterium]